MNSINTPQMRHLLSGEQFKILSVTGVKGCTMPNHYSTEEAVIIVQEGEALLNLSAKEIALKKNDTTIIPGGEHHTLTITRDFTAVVIMETSSEIKFVESKQD